MEDIQDWADNIVDGIKDGYFEYNNGVAKARKVVGDELETTEIVSENPEKYFYPNQFANQNNPLAHYRYTAEEIINDTDGELDVFVAGLGTSGTLMGVSKRLKEYNPK